MLAAIASVFETACFSESGGISVVFFLQNKTNQIVPEFQVDLRGATINWASKEKSSKKNVLEVLSCCNVLLYVKCILFITWKGVMTHLCSSIPISQSHFQVFYFCFQLKSKNGMEFLIQYDTESIINDWHKVLTDTIRQLVSVFSTHLSLN